jgi:peroxiredoxin
MADELARQRRELPWVPVEKEYRFATDEGMRTLAQLFDGRSQLLIYHFMFGPSWEAGCPVCSSIANTINGVLPHLHARGVTMFLVSHAPLEKLQAYKRRMGWVVPWASSFDSDFNFDFDVSFTDQQVKEFMGPVRESGSLPTVSQNAASTGTNENGYLSGGRARLRPGQDVGRQDEGDDTYGVLIKVYGGETNGAVGIIEQQFEPGFLLPPHVHQNDVWLYSLEGRCMYGSATRSSRRHRAAGC